MNWNGFVFNQNDDNREIYQKFNTMELEIEIDDPNEIVDEYFKIIKNASNQNELYNLLIDLFNEGVLYARKFFLLEQIEEKIEELNYLNFER